MEDPLKCEVSWPIPAVPFPPPFNHSHVVTIYMERGLFGAKLMALAHLMSRLSAFQPGRRRQACHLPLMTMLIPVEELASDKAPTSMTLMGPRMHRGGGRD